MNSKPINITLPAALLKQVDAAAKADFTTRSDFIRETLVRRLKHQRVVDEFGDEGSWSPIVDFRQHGYPQGMPADEFIKHLKALDGQDS